MHFIQTDIKINFQIVLRLQCILCKTCNKKICLVENNLQ